MSVRTLLIAYWIVLHLVFGLSLAWLLWEYTMRLWLLLAELGLVFSLVLAIWLSSKLLTPIQLIMKGVELIKDSNLSSKLVPLGQREADIIIHTYNKMIDSLRSERQYQQEKHFFLEKIIRASPSGIITLDYDEKISMINLRVQQMFGIEEKELLGKKPAELQIPHWNEIVEVLTRLEVGGSEVVTLPSRRKIRCTKSDFFDRGFPRIFFVLEELTEELRLSEKMAYEKLIRVISHEINNSIGAANSLLHTCLNYKEQLHPDDQEDFEMALSVVISRTEHLNSFMRNYAHVIRLHEPRRQLCDVLGLLENIALLYSAEFRKRDIELRWNMPEEPLSTMVMLDRAQIEQAFVNILKNAMEAIRTQGCISVSLGPYRHGLYISIEDNGCGIPPEVRANLFTPFFSTKENGQGIGLTMIQEILNRHQFEFELESEVGKFTRFSIYFLNE